MNINSTKDAEKNSIGIIHQELNLFPNLSVHENIFMGHEIFNYFIINKNKQKEITQKLMNKLNQKIKPDDLVETLRIGQQQIVEIAREFDAVPEITGNISISSFSKTDLIISLHFFVYLSSP